MGLQVAGTCSLRELGLADPRALCPQQPTDEEGFLHLPGEKSSENYQIIKGVSGWGPQGWGLQAFLLQGGPGLF